MGSHDFIQFPPDLGQLSAQSLLMLGEIQGIATTMMNAPMQPAHAQQLESEYLAKGAHSTTALAGGTFSEEQVLGIIGGSPRVDATRMLELQQIENMVEVYNMVARDELFGDSPAFSPKQLNRYHRLVLHGLGEISGSEINAGALRQRHAEVGQYLAPDPADCERLVQAFCDWLNDEDDNSDIVNRYSYDLSWSVMKAIAAHVCFAWIRPYSDGNGRMARLIEHIILLRAGLPEAATHLLSVVYSNTRERYYQELRLTHGDFRDGAYPLASDLGGFLEYALEGLVDELHELALVIRSVQVQAIWRDHIHACFPAVASARERRRKRLALDLTNHCLDQPVTISQVRKVSPAIEQEYADVSALALKQDLEALVKMDLLLKDKQGYQPNPQVMMSLFGNSGF